MEDYSTILREVSVPEVMETVFAKNWDDLAAIATEDTNVRGGASITVPIRYANTSNVETYDKSDVDTVAGVNSFVDATWTKLYQQTSAEVHNIDISQAQAGGQPAIANLITYAIAAEVEQLWEHIFDEILTQWKADIDSASTYSDAALSRSTYATLASTEESTDTPITLSLLRAQSNAAMLNKASGPKTGFQWLMETKVYERTEPLISALHGFNFNDLKAGQSVAGGYQAINSFEGVPIHTVKGMTVGDCYFFRKMDAKYQLHRPLTIEQDPSPGRDSVKFNIRMGINGYMLNPGFGLKMTSKD